MPLKSYIIILCVLISSFLRAQNKVKVDSLERLLVAAPDITKLKLLSDLTNELTVSNSSQALIYAEMGLQISNKLNLKKQVGHFSNIIGLVYLQKGEYKKALTLYLDALRINESIQEKSGISCNLSNIANIYRAQGNYEKALQYQFRSLKIEEALADTFGIAASKTNIGNYYSEQGDNVKALSYYEQALMSFRQLSDPQNTGTVINNIGAIYFGEEKFEAAIEKFNEAIKIYETIDDKYGIALDLNNISEVFVAWKKYDKALEYSKNSLDIAIEIGAKDIQKHNYQTLSEIFALTKDFASAYDYHKLYSATIDSLLSLETSKQITEMTVKYEIEKMDVENLYLKKETEKQKETTDYLLLGLVVLAGAGSGFFFRSRAKQRINEKLERIVGERTAELNSKNSQQELMLQEIHHRVKNNLQLISSILRMQIHFKGNKDVEQIVEICNNRIKCMAILHDKLYQSKDFSKINSGDYLSELINYISKNYDWGHAKVKVELNLINEYLHIDQLIPCGLIVNELVSNAYKYAFKPNQTDAILSVSLFKEHKENYRLIIKDNGFGFPEKFDVNNLSGLGLTIVQSQVEQLEGTIKFENNSGSVIDISIPVKVFKNV